MVAGLIQRARDCLFWSRKWQALLFVEKPLKGLRQLTQDQDSGDQRKFKYGVK